MSADFAEIGGEDRRPLHAGEVAAPESGAWARTRIGFRS
jgi:hypothetical protein